MLCPYCHKPIQIHPGTELYQFPFKASCETHFIIGLGETEKEALDDFLEQIHNKFEPDTHESVWG